jgi:hypothetical protein
MKAEQETERIMLIGINLLKRTQKQNILHSAAASERRQIFLARYWIPWEFATISLGVVKFWVQRH